MDTDAIFEHVSRLVGLYYVRSVTKLRFHCCNYSLETCQCPYHLSTEIGKADLLIALIHSDIEKGTVDTVKLLYGQRGDIIDDL